MPGAEPETGSGTRTPAADGAGEATTTGHSWDGIEEYDKPLPRWWLWTFYACILWAIGYWILMPAWPLVHGHTKGLLGYSQRAVVADRIERAEERRAPMIARIEAATLDDIRADPELLAFSLAAGRSAYAVNCMQCHGAGAEGGPGFPNLNDDAWLWGGTLDDIITTIRVGIRSDHPETLFGDMPAFGRDGLLDSDEIDRLVEYLRALSGDTHDQAMAESAAPLYAEACAACHGDDARGNPEFGAPDLTNGLWLYGGDRASLRESLVNGRAGMMPAWEHRLDPATIKLLAIYVHTLGGGQ